MNWVTEKIEKRHSRRRSLKWSMVRMLLFGWFFPLLLMILVMSWLITRNLYHQVEHTILTSLEKTVEMMQMQLEDCETASKNASYMAVIAQSYTAYLNDQDKDTFKIAVELFLKQQYGYNDHCRTAELVLTDETNSCFYALNNSNGGTYQDIVFFREKAKEIILHRAQTLDTATTLVGVEGRVYMIRNLVNSKFVPYAVLALELDKETLMESYEGVWGYQDAGLYWNGVLIAEGEGGALQIPEERIAAYLPEKDAVYDHCRGSSSYAYCRIRMYGEEMILAISLDNKVIHGETKGIQYFFLLLIVSMIPLIIMMLLFFHRKVNVPLGELIAAADAVREGELGIQIPNEAGDEEVHHVKDSFNHMSLQLKSQFDKIYLEEIALRDARIMALQSQINPHFLNNTLEIINWEARLNGNYKVSGMIEALSTMLGATMNRQARQFHSVAEEMAYADAYLYIISQRFGAKFQCTQHIDERLMNVQVPRLIVQPIVENAVEHGMDISKQGRLVIRLYERCDGYLCIEVEDNGHLKQEAKDKIARLLAPDAELTGEKSVSLGIRNVDQRLKMIYGSDCGLFITGNEQENTISTILLKMDVPKEQ